ncbi:hypothetical protein ERC79_04070 [Rhodococcus sp. ABRD24]|uniref:hypothetical protein n=1 Tax=Rhodococcus sp. ABRD24 TaxID=2507582 RepID=UPI00103CDB79|nr:hypothetical protein [Rhodococcus sp. ABRD24]QBJ95224.1 hypothetical protein ERC79_04070 [Rhodococcus sp. ABRD24]
MITIRGKQRILTTLRDNVTVTSGAVLDLEGMVTGQVTVNRGGVANIRGMVAGVRVLAGGEAIVHGMCNGPASNSGGRLEILGLVTGPVLGDDFGTVIAPGARVGSTRSTSSSQT